MSSPCVEQEAPRHPVPLPQFPWGAVILPIAYQALFWALMIYLEVRR